MPPPPPRPLAGGLHNADEIFAKNRPDDHINTSGNHLTFSLRFIGTMSLFCWRWGIVVHGGKVLCINGGSHDRFSFCYIASSVLISC